MAARFINIDRQTPLLLPPDLRDWVAEDDLVHFVIEAVERLPLSTFAVNHRGSGDAQFPPAMMLALLIYCYANGVFGSRRIERATHRDVAVRYLCADTHPDHDTICTFRRNNLEAVATAFVDVLELARELRLLKLGCVSLDGTHIRASASKDKNVTYQRAGELRAQLRLDVDELLAQAEASDREDTDPQALPKEIARREKLLGKMDTACAQLEARAQARAAAEQADYERKVAARAEREGSAKGPEPKPPRATPEPDEQINLSDPDARLMRKSKREGYTQSDNAQAIVDADGSQLIPSAASGQALGQRVSTCAADVGETAADLAAIPPSLGTPTAALADCGYADKATLERLGRDRPGLDLYISVHREDAHAERRYDWRPLDKIKAPQTPTDPVLIAMAEKLRTPRGQSPLPAARLHRRTRLRHHQKRARVPAVFAARPEESQRRMEPRVPGLQLQTAPHPAPDGHGRLSPPRQGDPPPHNAPTTAPHRSFRAKPVFPAPGWPPPAAAPPDGVSSQARQLSPTGS